MGDENFLELSISRNDEILLGSNHSFITNSSIPLSINCYNHDSSAILDQHDLSASAGYSTATDVLLDGKLSGCYNDDSTALRGGNTKKKARLDLGLFTNAPIRFYSPNPQPPPIIQPEVKRSRYLPDDILHEILSRALRVSDANFTIDVDRSPFGRQPPSAVNILSVCQQWYRVGHPYLYECLVLRNTFQLQSFYNMLMWYKQGKTDYQKAKMERLRLGVRRLRLEDAFGPLLLKLLKVLDVSRIVSLFIKVDRYDDERSKSACSGIEAGIESIDPNHAILDWEFSLSFFPAKIADMLSARVPQWRRLEALEVHTHHMQLPVLPDLVDNLLKTRTDPLQILFRLRNQQSLQRLVPIFWQCEESKKDLTTSLLIDMPSHEVAKAEERVKDCMSTLPKALKILSPTQTPGIYSQLYRPQADDKKDVQNQIRRFPVPVILRIVDFVLESPERIVDETQYNGYLHLYRKLREASQFGGFKTYCTNICWKTIYLSNMSKLEYLSSKNVFLLDSTGPRVVIRRRLDQLIINPNFEENESWRNPLSSVHLLFEAMLQNVLILSIPLRHSMLPHAPNTRLHTLTLVMKYICAGPCSSDMFFLSADPKTSDVRKLFACFPNVQHLFLTGHTFTEGYLLARPTSYLRQSTVQDIHLDGSDESLLVILKCMFVSVTTLHLGHTGTRRPVNVSTILYHTPNLHTLYISLYNYRSYFFETLDPNCTIKKIVLCGTGYSSTWFSTLVEILQRIDIALFENLEEMQFEFFKQPWTWSKSESSYMKWTILAGQAVEKYGVKFTNMDGVTWVPRLYCAPQRLPQPKHVPRPRKRKRGSCE